MPRGTSSALETLLLVLVCTLCKGTAKLLRKKKQPLLCASDLGARYSGVPTHPTISLPGVNLGNHFESSGTCPNASKKNSLGKFTQISHLAAWQKGCARAWAADGRAPGRFQKHWKGHFGQPRRHQENSGYLPLRQRYPNAPAVKISTFSEYLPLQTSGARYSRVPTRPRISPPFVNLGNHLE
jgi:hypothetical protein